MRSLDAVEAALRLRLLTEGVVTDGGAVPSRSNPERAVLSSAQQGVWTYQELVPDSVVYNLCLALTFDGLVDDLALEQAFAAVVERHEILRTTYHSDAAGSPYQRIHASLPHRSTRIDVGDGPDAVQRYRDLLDDLVAEPFDLAVESSLRLTVARMGDDRTVAIVLMQHIAWDGMTLQALSRDVEQFYRLALDGKLDAEPLALQVADFAEWENAEFDKTDQTPAVSFWENTWRSELDALQLPYDRRPAHASSRGARLDRSLDVAAAENLRGLSTRLRATPFEVFLAAYYVALRQITGQHDLVVGTTVANREAAGQELLIGNLSNMVALRFDSDDSRTFADLVGHVHQVKTDAFRHKHFPYEEVVRIAKRVNPTVGNQLFDTMVLFLDQKIDGPTLPGCTTTWELVDNGSALLPIAVEAFLLADRVDVQITFQTDLFGPETIARLHEYIDQVLTRATASTAIGDLAALSSSDSARVDRWTSGPAMEITPTTVDAMTREAAQKYPDRIAVVFGDVQLTYGQFDSAVNKFARALLDRGIRPGDFVAVHADRSEWLAVIVAGLLRAGGVYVPIDPDYPADRVEYIVDDARPAIVVRHLTAERTPPALNVPVLDLADPAVVAEIEDTDGDSVRQDELERQTVPGEPAYLIYTSGTTGKPKGVVIDHRAVSNRVQWMRNHFGMIETERVLQKTPIGFDVSVCEIIAAVSSGASLVLAQPGWWWMDAHALTDFIEKYRITVLSFVPTMLRAFLDAGTGDDRLRSVRFLFCGGEAVSPWLADEAGRAFDCPVIGLYGPSEATMDITYEDFSGITDDTQFRSSLIGIPESNSSVWVLDSALRQVPQGVTAELYVGGVQLAIGYHDRPGLTAGAFVANPFSEPGDRMYRTGDLVRWSPTGRLEFIGRADDQVKIRGHRIELGEIGTVLRQVPGVMSAAATAIPRDAGPVLAAYYIADTGTEEITDEQHADDIKSYLAQRLPSYMVPTILVKMTSLPFTANGKLDQKALPIPDFGDKSGTGRALRGETEHIVAEIVRATLEIPEATVLGADDDFLGLGGDSISAIRMAAALKKRGLHVTTKALFEARTIALIAAATEQSAVDDAPPLVVVETETGEVPLNPVAAMLIDKVVDYSGYCQATAVVTPADATADRLAEVLDKLVAAHPMLSASVGRGADGQAVFVVPEDPVTAALTEVVLPPDGSVEDVLAVQLRAAGSRMNPGVGHVVEVVWINRGNETPGRLLLVIHHLVVDGVSWRVIGDDLRRFWSGGGVDEVVSTSVKQWNTSLTDLALSSRFTEQIDFWSGPGVPEPTLGTRLFDPAVDLVSTVREVTVTLGPEETEALTDTVPRAFRCDLVDVQLAALVVAVRRHRGGGALSVNLERHGREEALFSDADLSDTVGWFTSIYPVTFTDSSVDMVDAIKSVKEDLLAVPDAGIGWGLLRWLNKDTRSLLSERTEPRVSFNYMGRFALGDEQTRDWGPAPEFPYLSGYADENMPSAAILDVNTVTLVDGDEARLEASFRFPEGVLTGVAAQEIADSWVTALREITAELRRDPQEHRTPSDVLAEGVTQLDLDGWQKQYGDVVDVYPLAPMQEAMYLAGVTSAGDVYSVQMLIGVRGDLDTPRLVESMNLVADRYPNLRVSIGLSRAGKPVGIVPAHIELEVRELDFATGVGDVPEALEQLLDEDMARHFDVSAGPLLRAMVVHLPDDEHLMVLTAHHIISDGWSGQLMPGEVFVDYATRVGSDALEPSTAFAEFVTLIRDRRQEADQAWARYLAPVSEPTIVAPEHSSGEMPVDHEFEIAPDIVERLRAIATDGATTLSSVCQLAWANVLRQFTGQRRIVFGEVVAGRPTDIDDIDSAVGSYANTVPRVFDLVDDRSWREHLDVLQRERVELMEYEQYSITEAHRVTGVRRLFDTMIAFQSYPSGRAEMERLLNRRGLDLVSFSARGESEHALRLTVFPDDGLRIVLSYAATSFDMSDVEIIESAFDGTLRSIAEQPDAPLGDADVLDENDQAYLTMRRSW
ncbi:non-ribosomal peptide synthetase [Rhodococcoides kyotonense]|uniref:Non-ribosomal peptide synthase domain TIGR01720/amino acid adenylation domain-containing protein n=1 Tax=Rhodococcoides kyotonense TaxID=398843 RepID=A0A239N2S7_9NOCA|nr:non-ribosomal peptide synthetase [Rhodococcus kyotonensis]SNT49256.1 non-ribosomal peptide synthase domain TIGR01720/amino acid adenylation domain-containing protein [Rhodococcus kyotonensis]